jgi:hypothetical protein
MEEIKIGIDRSWSSSIPFDLIIKPELSAVFSCYWTLILSWL